MNKLDKLGYRLWGVELNEDLCIFTDPERGLYSVEFFSNIPHPEETDSIDCDTNEELFLAIAALRDDTDENQWFTDGNDWFLNVHSVSFKDDIARYEIYGSVSIFHNHHKATVKELIEHFLIMTKEDKQLLIEDLCAKLPYKVMIRIKDTEKPAQLTSVEFNPHESDDALVYVEYFVENIYYYKKIDEIKPYLFPLSSVNKEQYNESICAKIDEIKGHYKRYLTPEDCILLNINHFDYRGLIDRGLAIDATGLNIY